MVNTLMASGEEGLPTPGIVLPSNCVPLMDSLVLFPYGWCEIMMESAFLGVAPLISGYEYIPTLATKAVFLSGLKARPKGWRPTLMEAVILLVRRSTRTR